MIDTDKYEKLIESIVICEEEYIKGSDNLLEDSQRLKDCSMRLLAEVKRLQKENKILANYRDIVQKYDDALLADGDTDIRWSAIYDERVFE